MAKPKADEWLDDEKLVLLEGWARDGLTDEQISENMGISVRTLYRWKVKHCQICQALKKGKDAADREIENALFKRAKGYDFTETRKKIKNGVVVEETTTIKHIPGDTTAQIFWLKNRKPGYWGNGNDFMGDSDGTEVEIYIPDNGRGGENGSKE
ncbi:helix-turn-helix domain-containing protein [bacterium D16-51]|nr:helix-turn-helix domain-containing protein [bacterium D16-59]RKI53336.1 helix-turn-helix domain-containing protein [bacterium D16-51]